MARHLSPRRKESPQSSPKPPSEALQTRPFAPAPESQEPASPSLNPNISLPQFSIEAPQGSRPQPIQPKFTIGAPGDKYEQEADRVASQVVQHIHSPSSNPAQSVQREAMPEEDELQMKPMLQRETMPEEEELQMKSIPNRGIVEGEASPNLETEIQQSRGRGQALDPELQTQMGQAMGADFSGVRVHTDRQSDQLNRSIQAKAFTTGQDIFFRQGAYQPSNRGGQELIAHELTHVVQQNGSAIQTKRASLQRVLEGIDPIADGNVLDPNHVNDLLYGLTNYRGATMTRMAEPKTRKRTVDEYNASIGINGNIINGRLACIGIYIVRNALDKPAQWRSYLSASEFNYPDDGALLAYMQGGGDLSNEQKWMTFLVREKHHIGLWDLGDTERPVIGKNLFGVKKRGEEAGVSRIKNKRRFGKNMNEDDAGTFSEKDVNKMLSFGLDLNAAQAYYEKLDAAKQQGLNRWIQNAFWRRTSKLGIDFATSDIGLNARIHFNLASGEKQLGGGWQAKLWGLLDDIAKDEGTRKITESEWRYVLRMMDKKPEMLRKIFPYSEHT